MINLVVGILLGAAIVLGSVGYAGINKRVSKLETTVRLGHEYPPRYKSYQNYYNETQKKENEEK